MRILVVDDEPTQLEMICRGLFVCGHDAAPARSVADVKALLAARGAGAFDLLLTDITRSDGWGPAYIQVAPSLPILIITGLTHGPGLAAVHRLGAPVLAKPFTPDELDAAVRAAAARADHRRPPHSLPPTAK